MTNRRAMTPARKARIHASRNGLCGECALPVEASGRDVVYDHRGTLFITESDDDSTIWPLHKACDAKKTPLDLRRIAKTKRQMKMRVGVERKPSRLKSRGFDKSVKRKIANRPFPKRG